MEIGHEYHLVFEDLTKKKANIFNFLSGFNTLYLDSGRSAINILSSMLCGGEILVPSYACVSVMHSFKKSVSVGYYNVFKDFSIDFEDLKSKITQRTRALYLIHFFGRIYSEDTLRELKNLCEKNHMILIEDTTHSILTSPCTVGDYMVCSLRKWFPVPDGGVIYSKNALSELDLSGIKKGKPDDKAYAMAQKTLYLRNIVPSKDAAEEIFMDTEKRLDERGDREEAALMNDFTYFLLECSDVDEVREKRIRNHKLLRSRIHNEKIRWVYPEFDEQMCPFMLIIYSDNRDYLRKYLLSHGIRASVHWFTMNTELGAFENSVWIAEHILSIPIDQRYSDDEMMYMAEVINRY